MSSLFVVLTNQTFYLPVILTSKIHVRGIEWSFRAFVSIRTVRFFLRALRKFSASWNLSILKHCFVPSNLAVTFKTGQQAHGQDS